jgi:hypothetical protein
MELEMLKTKKEPNLFKNKLKYITGDIYQGRFVPMGWSKDLKYAKEIAKLHKHILCSLTKMEDYR